MVVLRKEREEVLESGDEGGEPFRLSFVYEIKFARAVLLTAFCAKCRSICQSDRMRQEFFRGRRGERESNDTRVIERERHKSDRDGEWLSIEFKDVQENIIANERSRKS